MKFRATLAALVAALFLASQSQSQASGSRIYVCILEVSRGESTLRKDGEMMDKFLEDAKPGDLILGITTHGDEIFALELDPAETNRLVIKDEYKKTRAELGGYFIELFKAPPEEPTNDVADAIHQAIDWCNSAPSAERISIIVFGSGLYDDGDNSFRGCYPNFPWIANPLSPFSMIPRNGTTALAEALFVYQKGDFVSSYHARKMEEWYKAMLHHYGLQLSSFSHSHRTTKKVLERGFREVPPPAEVDLTGELLLICLDPLASEDTEE